MKSIARFVQHCEEGCGLGYVEYECPACHRHGNDYGDGWFDHENIYSGHVVEFECEHCRTILLMSWDQEEMEAVLEAKP